eukprot:SAG11_NODE_845_length_6885_cov_6.782346_7_plen_141_part_00
MAPPADIYISIDKLILQNLDDNSDHTNIFCINVQMSIPSANYYSTFFDDNTPRNTGYGETIPMYSGLGSNNLGSLKVGGMSYVNNNPSRHVLCTNPFGNKYNVTFFECNGTSGARSLNTNLSDNIILTLRVEILKEAILR